jgi:hypothetical protein
MVWRQLRKDIDYKSPASDPAVTVGSIHCPLCFTWPLQISHLVAICRLPGSSLSNPQRDCDSLHQTFLSLGLQVAWLSIFPVLKVVRASLPERIPFHLVLHTAPHLLNAFAWTFNKMEAGVIFHWMVSGVGCVEGELGVVCFHHTH